MLCTNKFALNPLKGFVVEQSSNYLHVIFNKSVLLSSSRHVTSNRFMLTLQNFSPSSNLPLMKAMSVGQYVILVETEIFYQIQEGLSQSSVYALRVPS